MRKLALVLSCLLIAMTFAPLASADAASDRAAIKKVVEEIWKKVAKRQYDGTDMNPAGAIQATSQGGLWTLVTRESQIVLLNNSPNKLMVEPNHIEVTFLGSSKDAAHVTFYLTGTIELSDGSKIQNYRTRASLAMEKIGGSWVTSGAHYSPLFGGSGVKFD